MAINHPNAKRTYFTWEGPWDAYHMVLVIETDLHLNPQHPDFDLNAVNTLKGQANRYILTRNRQIDHLRLLSLLKD
jgi:hypothetical protein